MAASGSHRMKIIVVPQEQLAANLIAGLSNPGVLYCTQDRYAEALAVTLRRVGTSSAPAPQPDKPQCDSTLEPI